MKSRDLAALLFGLAGLYSLLLALLGLAQLVPNLPLAVRHAGGQTQLESAVVGATVSLALHLCFGGALLTGRRKLAEWLVPDDDGAAPASSPSPAAPAAPAAKASGERASQPPARRAGATALGLATAGVCAVAILLLARIVTAASYATYLLFTRNSEGDLFASTAAGVLIDLLLVVVGGWLLARRTAVAATLVGGAPAVAAPAGDLSWQLPALRFLGLATVVWHLPALVSALGVLVKWWVRPLGFDLRLQALDRIPPAATGVAVGLYLLLLFPRGAGAVARRLQPPPDVH